jgi:hypothetical protein
MTIPAMWNCQRFTVTVGFHPDTGEPLEVFAGEAKGAMLAQIADACVALSIAMQHGATPAELRRSMGRVPDWVLRDGDMVQAETPASPVGAILDAITGAAE